MYDDDYKVLKDFVRNGNYVYPESGLLVLVWKTLAMYNNMKYEDLSVTFSDVKFYDSIVFDQDQVLSLGVSLRKGLNKFEVTNNGKLIVIGTFKIINDNHFQNHKIEIFADDLIVTKDEIYKLLSMYGFSLGSSFQSIEAIDSSMNKAIIKWNNDWATYIDSVFQMNLLAMPSNMQCRVKHIGSLSIHRTKHTESLITHNVKAEKYVYANRNLYGVTFCGGIVCESVIFEEMSFALLPNQIFTQEFVPHFGNHPVDVTTAAYVNMQIVYDNTPNDQVLVNLIESDNENIASDNIKRVLFGRFLFELEVKQFNIHDFNNLNLPQPDIVVCTDVSSNKVIQKVLVEELSNHSFLMLMGDRMEIESLLTKHNIELVSRFEVNNFVIVLLRKRRETKIVGEPMIVSCLDDLKFESQNVNKHVILLDCHSDFAPISYRSITKESMKYGKTISIFNVPNASSASLLNKKHNLVKNKCIKEQAVKGIVFNMLRNNEWGGYYYIPYKSAVATKNVELTKKLNSASTKSIKVYYSSLYALGMTYCKDILLKDDRLSHFGMDFSGIDSNGNRVMGCKEGETISISVSIAENLLWQVPKHWSLEDAATVPLPYFHAYYCLTIRYQLKSKSTVLVTEGARALGQALISICLSQDCKVFVTVNSQLEKASLLRLFPQLIEDDVRISFELDFCEFITNSTHNKRCCVVINSSTGKLREAAMACVTNFGYFLDVSEIDMKENDIFAMNFVDYDKSYISIRLGLLFNKKMLMNKEMTKLHGVITEGIANGTVRPLLRKISHESDVSNSFSLSTITQHLRRTVIKMNDENYSQEIMDSRLLTLHSEKVYIVIWDGSEFGVEFISRLIERGAKYLIIHSKQATLTGYYLAKRIFWTLVKIEICNEPLISLHGCMNLIESGKKIGIIDGIFIIDSNLEINKRTRENVKLITSNLDITSRDISTLSYFVSLKLVAHNDSGDKLFTEFDGYFMERRKLGFPSLHIVYKLKEMENNKNYGLKIVSTILNGFEECVNCKKNIVIADLEQYNKKYLNLANSDKKALSFKQKLNIFIDDIVNDEYQATEPMFSMKTLTSKHDEEEICFDPDDRKAIIISGFLGNCRKLSSIANSLKISAIGLQISPNINGDIPKMAENLLQFLKMKIRLKSKFYMVAYSFGVNIALEVTFLLEQQGYHGIVFCLDSSPLALQYQLKAYFGELTEDQLQNSVLHHTYKLLANTSSQNLAEELQKCENWSKKIEVFINDIKSVVSHSHGYLKDVVNALYSRIVLAVQYKPNMNLNSEIVLIKGIPDSNMDMLPFDYGLSEFTSKPIKVINVNSSHVSVPNDNKIPSIINGMLEPELLKLFANKNMCEA